MRHRRAGAFAILPLALFAGVMALEPIAQSVAYHDFADRRTLLGVPNLLDVASNLAFLIVGALGIVLCAGPRRPPLVASWMVFFIATVLTGFGSARYHWAPNDDALMWDRLPMAVAFMGLLVALVAEIEDRDIFTLTAHVVSGHTLKHLLAAGAVFALVVMLRRREADDA